MATSRLLLDQGPGCAVCSHLMHAHCLGPCPAECWARWLLHTPGRVNWTGGCLSGNKHDLPQCPGRCDGPPAARACLDLTRCPGGRVACRWSVSAGLFKAARGSCMPPRPCPAVRMRVGGLQGRGQGPLCSLGMDPPPTHREGWSCSEAREPAGQDTRVWKRRYVPPAAADMGMGRRWGTGRASLCRPWVAVQGRVEDCAVARTVRVA